MADFSALKTSIQNYIKQNGNNEITGAILQQILLSMVTALGDNAINDLVSALGDEVVARQNADGTLQDNIDSESTARSQADGTLQQNINNEATARENADGTLQTNINNEATTRGNADTELGGRITTLQGVVNGIKANIENGYVYAGIATPSTTPANGKVFYLALTAGTYTNFGSTVVPQGINILKYNGTAWSLDSFIGLDDAPTTGSNNFVKSGGVFNDIMTNGSAFDLSAYNNGTTYADLNDALIALNALPAAYKKGGMSVKFIQSSNNNYKRYNLISNTFTTDTTKWMVVDDELSEISENIYGEICNEASTSFSNYNNTKIVCLPAVNKEYKINKIGLFANAGNYNLCVINNVAKVINVQSLTLTNNVAGVISLSDYSIQPITLGIGDRLGIVYNSSTTSNNIQKRTAPNGTIYSVFEKLSGIALNDTLTSAISDYFIFSFWAYINEDEIYRDIIQESKSVLENGIKEFQNKISILDKVKWQKGYYDANMNLSTVGNFKSTEIELTDYRGNTIELSLNYYNIAYCFILDNDDVIVDSWNNELSYATKTFKVLENYKKMILSCANNVSFDKEKINIIYELRKNLNEGLIQNTETIFCNTSMPNTTTGSTGVFTAKTFIYAIPPVDSDVFVTDLYVNTAKAANYNIIVLSKDLVIKSIIPITLNKDDKEWVNLHQKGISQISLLKGERLAFAYNEDSAAAAFYCKIESENTNCLEFLNVSVSVGTQLSGGATTKNLFINAKCQNQKSYAERIKKTEETNHEQGNEINENKSDIEQIIETITYNQLDMDLEDTTCYALGDSTVAQYGGSAIISLLGSHRQTVDLAVAGINIANDMNLWANTPKNPDNISYVVIQLGHNDLAPTNSAQNIITALQNAVNSVRNDSNENTKIIIAQLTPAHQRYIDLYGDEDGEIVYQNWILVNEAIAGSGNSPITGVNGRVTTYNAIIGDANGNLLPQYNNGDNIHENEAAREIIAQEWLKIIKKCVLVQ